MRFILATLCLVLTACGPSQRAAIKQNRIPSYNPSNAYAAQTMPAHIQRVLLMPVSNSEQEWTVLDPIDDSFKSELIKTQLFEVITIGRNELQSLFGKSHFSSTETFPADFVLILKNQYHADAVFLLDLTHFRPYKPISIGIRAKLVDLHNNNLLWAFDTLFDAGDPRVAMGARRYQQRFSTQSYPLDEPITVLQSPKTFSRYLAFTTFQSLHQLYIDSLQNKD